MKFETKSFDVTVSDEAAIIRNFAVSNRQYGKKKPAPGETIPQYLFKQSNATVNDDQVFAGKILIGTIKKGNVSRIRNLTNSPTYSHSAVTFRGGACISNNLNGNGDLIISQSKSRIFAKLNVYLKVK